MAELRLGYHEIIIKKPISLHMNTQEFWSMPSFNCTVGCLRSSDYKKTYKNIVIGNKKIVSYDYVEDTHTIGFTMVNGTREEVQFEDEKKYKEALERLRNLFYRDN